MKLRVFGRVVFHTLIVTIVAMLPKGAFGQVKVLNAITSEEAVDTGAMPVTVRFLVSLDSAEGVLSVGVVRRSDQGEELEPTITLSDDGIGSDETQGDFVYTGSLKLSADKAQAVYWTAIVQTTEGVLRKRGTPFYIQNSFTCEETIQRLSAAFVSRDMQVLLRHFPSSEDEGALAKLDDKTRNVVAQALKNREFIKKTDDVCRIGLILSFDEQTQERIWTLRRTGLGDWQVSSW